MQSGVLVADRFEVERQTASGGMSVVYRARDRVSGQVVALKVLSAQGMREADRFRREAHLLAELDAPGIVKYVDHGETDGGHFYLAMEWLEGESLSERLARAPLGVLESVELIRRVAEALARAHERGIVHRDIKPSNLFLPAGDFRQVKLLDFGIARLSEGTRNKPTMTGMLMGTPGYMAPEQARGGHEVDARSDVFSLGCVLFECVAGRPVFVGEHIMALLAKILLEDAPRLHSLRADVPASLDGLVARMLAKDPASRPADAAAVATELSRIGADNTLPSSADITANPPTVAITQGEQRLVCVLFAGEARAELSESTPAPHGATLRALRTASGPYGGRMDQLVDGSVIWALSGTGVATDQAAQAARCALAVRSVLRRVPMVLATGRGVVSEHWSTGEVIDRAARILRARAGAPGEDRPIVLDEVTAGLLDARFLVASAEDGPVLLGEREQLDASRTLLGKPTPCVGRDRELGTLDAIFAECVGEPVARAVLLTAPAGVGKSRLRHEFVRRLVDRDENVEIWLGRGDLMKVGSPFGLIAPALRRAAGVIDGEPLEVRRQKLRARVARGQGIPAAEQPRVAAFLGELVGIPFDEEQSPALRAARGNSMLMGDQMRRAWEELVAAECADRPLLLVLEDLQWGDLPTVKLVDAALRNLRDRPLLVLAVARPEVHDLFPGLWRERGMIEIAVGELTKKAAERLVRQVVGDRFGADEIARIVAQAEGNAFYLEELVRAHAERGDGGTLPETVVAMVQARLERLEPEARRVMRAASVFGDVFWRGGVLALLGSGSRTAQVAEWLSELAARELIVPQPKARFGGAEEIEYAFRHKLVREAAYAMLTEEDRRLGHLLAAEWLEQAGETDAVTLAEHLERGGAAARSVTWYRRAAEQALEGNDLENALYRARRGVDLGASADLGALRLVEAEANAWRGDHAEAAAAADQALLWLDEGSPAWCVAAAHAAEASSRMGDVDRLVVLGERLAALPGAGPRPTMAMARAAVQLILHGKIPLADRLLVRLQAVRGRFPDDPAAAAWTEDAFAVRALFGGDLGAYLENKERVVEAFAAAGLLRSECVQRARLGYACMEVGDYPRAIRELEASLVQSTRLGLHHPMALAKHNLGLALGRSGRLEEARSLETEAIELFHAQKDQRLEGASRLYLGQILALGGDPAAAEQEIAAAVAVTKERSPVWALAMAQLARARLDLGRVDEALAAAKDAHDVLEALGGLDEGESVVRLAWAESLLGAGRADEARAALARARERLLERADRISDPRLRESFLQRVPENARTLALASG